MPQLKGFEMKSWKLTLKSKDGHSLVISDCDSYSRSAKVRDAISKIISLYQLPLDLSHESHEAKLESAPESVLERPPSNPEE